VFGEMVHFGSAVVVLPVVFVVVVSVAGWKAGGHRCFYPLSVEYLHH
jgi:hypothetical protein